MIRSQHPPPPLTRSCQPKLQNMQQLIVNENKDNNSPGFGSIEWCSVHLPVRTEHPMVPAELLVPAHKSPEDKEVTVVSSTGCVVGLW